MTDQINPGAVFDLTLPLEEAAEAYKAMDARRATKVMLTLSDYTPSTFGGKNQAFP